MANLSTNFFEIFISPKIETLYQSPKTTYPEDVNFLSINFSKDEILSFKQLPNSKSVKAKVDNISWLLRKVIFSKLFTQKGIFDVDVKYGSGSIRSEKLFEVKQFVILRRILVKVFHSFDRYYLSLSPYSKIYGRISLEGLISEYHLPIEELININCLIYLERNHERNWVPGRIIEISNKGFAKVSFGTEILSVKMNRIIPSLSRTQIKELIKKDGTSDIDNVVFQRTSGSQKAIDQQIINIFNLFIKPLFPIIEETFKIEIADEPSSDHNFIFYSVDSKSEAKYIIQRENVKIIENSRRLAGLSKINLEDNFKSHNVVLFSTKEHESFLHGVVDKLNNGIKEGDYFFSLPSKYGINLNIADTFITENHKQYLNEISKFVLSPIEKHNALALIYLPPASEFYYQLKAYLAHYGKVSQVVSKENLNINFAWNLGTNIYAKLGYKPWSIQPTTNHPLPDIIIGFAYSSLRSDSNVRKNIGYVNVFDNNGVWQFMQTSFEYLDFDKRLTVIPQIITNAILSYKASQKEVSTIDVHYTKRFSKRERDKTYQSIINFIPEIREVNFVSIDNTHSFELFDKSNPYYLTKRGVYLPINPNEFLLSTSGITGNMRSKILKLTVWDTQNQNEIDFDKFATRILSLTKLNWRSAVRDSTEPVTLKYASEVARLTNYFHLTEWKEINNQLSKIPWFI